MSKEHSGETPASLAGSVTDFAKDVALLVREDLQSVRADLADKAKTAGVGAGMLSGSAVAGLLTLASLTALAAVLLSAVVQPWLALLIVTLIWAAASALLAIGGKRKFADVGKTKGR